MESRNNTVTYSANYRLRATYLEVFSYYVVACKKYKKFIWVNFLKHFKASFQKSLMRKVWMIVIPLVPVSVYVGLQQFGLLRGTSDMPKVIYVVVGMTFWQIFSNSLLLSMSAPSKEKAMLQKINMPFFLFNVSAMGTVIFDFLVRILLIFGLLVGFNVEFSFSWLLLPLMIIPLVSLGFSLGIFLSFFSIYFDDIKNVTDICIRYGLFASGVIFPLPKEGVVSNVLHANPVFILLDNLRNLLVFSEFSNLSHFLLIIILSILFLIFILRKLYILEPRMREYL
jgi:lipopolysaccharide transport system permease protein